jgi:hypothetical protein
MNGAAHFLSLEQGDVGFGVLPGKFLMFHKNGVNHGFHGCHGYSCPSTPVMA